mgnify:CR=1 FL=1
MSLHTRLHVSMSNILLWDELCSGWRSHRHYTSPCISICNWLLLVRWVRDKIPCLLLIERLHLLVHHFNPSRSFSGFRTFRFLNCRYFYYKGILAHHIVVVTESVGDVFSRVERKSFSFSVVRAFFDPGVLMIGTSKPPSWLSSEWVDLLSSDWSSSYSDIFSFPLSDFRLGHDILCSLGGSWGLLNLIEIGLSLDINLSWSLSSVCLRLAVYGSGGVGSGLYHGADLSKTTSLLTWTIRVEGLKHLYPFFSSVYPMRIHFSDMGSSFCRFSSGMCTYAIELIILICDGWICMMRYIMWKNVC